MRVKNEKGVVMMMVLLIATITLSVTTTMLYMLLQSTKFSGMQQRYSSSSEAAMAATDIVREVISKGGLPSLIANLNTSVGYTNSPGADTCIRDKREKDTADWGVGWGGTCNNEQTINYEDPLTYDSSFSLGDYDVYTKTVFTIQGNTGGGGATQRFTNTCVTDCGVGFGGFSLPYTYSIEVLAKHRNIPTEFSRYSILYQN